MLRVGLTGGIGSGKSTVARRLAQHGAVIIDADVVAREVVAPGTSGLRQVVATFGDGLLSPDGALDRAQLARLVFADPDDRRRLNAIVHPLVRARTEELTAAAPAAAVVVNDVPLLAETGLAPAYQLVVVVQAPEQLRVARLVGERGMSAPDAQARVATQATEAERAAVADVLLDNTGSVAALYEAVDAVWQDRIAPFADNLRECRPAGHTTAVIVPADLNWPRQFHRLAERIRHAVGDLGVDHIGSTAVRGLAAKDVIDLQLTVDSLEQADALGPAITDAGFPTVRGIDADRPKPSLPDPGQWGKRLHASADPGRPAHLHLRVAGSPGWRYALLFRDWLRADAAELVRYEAVKRRLADDHLVRADYAEAKEPWFDAALQRAESWAARTGWQPPGG